MKKTSTNKKTTKYSRKAKIIVSSGLTFLVLYVIGLINPYTGPAFQYPYYQAFCGSRPVVANDFWTKYYHTPDMRSYRPPGLIGIGSEKLYCTESEAQAQGYNKSVAP